MIEPTLEQLRAEGIQLTGPLPADTLFTPRRLQGADAVLAMYHDQGQIAMKMMGFDRGITLIGGYAFPVCTPAHGTGRGPAAPLLANQARPSGLENTSTRPVWPRPI